MSSGEQTKPDDEMIQSNFVMENIADGVLAAVDSSEITSVSDEYLQSESQTSVYSKLGRMSKASQRIVLEILNGCPSDSTDIKATRIARASLADTQELNQPEVMASFQRLNEDMRNKLREGDENDIRINNCYEAIYEALTSAGASFDHPLAACKGLPSEWFFPVKGESGTKAQEICSTCPAKEPCGDFARKKNIYKGIWGGTTEYARRQFRKSKDDQRRAS